MRFRSLMTNNPIQKKKLNINPSKSFRSMLSLSILFSAILMAGCGASKQQAMLDTINSPQTRPATFEALNEDFTIAEREQVNLISPEKFLSARKALQTAESLRAEGQPQDKYSKELEQSRTELD